MKKILLDTDIGPDCDDAAALALVNMYAAEGMVEVLAVTHCTSNPYGVGAIRAIDAWYGHDFPVGTLKDEGFLTGEQTERYNRPLALELPPERREAEAAVPVMRRALAACGDGEAELIAIGPLRNVAALLASPPDDISTLDGERLSARKCARLTLMAGCFELAAAPGMKLPRVEWNVEMDVAAARTVLERWHTGMVWCGWELGAQVITGRTLPMLPAGHPVRRAYELHGSAAGRPSWDLLTVQHACCPDCELTSEGEAGPVTMDGEGATSFRAHEGGAHRVLRLKCAPERIAGELDGWLLRGGRARA